MVNMFEGGVLPQESGNHTGQIKSLIGSFSGEDRELFEQYMQLPNRPDIQPEVVRLVIQYGEKFASVTDRVEGLRQRLGMNYGDLRKEILDQLGK